MILPPNVTVTAGPNERPTYMKITASDLNAVLDGIRQEIKEESQLFEYHPLTVEHNKKIAYLRGRLDAYEDILESIQGDK